MTWPARCTSNFLPCSGRRTDNMSLACVVGSRPDCGGGRERAVATGSAK